MNGGKTSLVVRVVRDEEVKSDAPDHGPHPTRVSDE